MIYRVAEQAGFVFLGGFVLLGLLVACTSGPSAQDPTWKVVRITDISTVAGEWEGLVKKEHDSFPKGSVRLMIRPNNTYLFAGESASTVAVGSGDLRARDGRLVGDTDKRAVTFTLYDHKGKVVMLLESTNHETGERHRGEFTKVK